MLRGIFSHAKNHSLSPLAFLRETGQPIQVIDAFKLYEKRLKDANALDFDDLLLFTIRLFEQFPDVLPYLQAVHRPYSKRLPLLPEATTTSLPILSSLEKRGTFKCQASLTQPIDTALFFMSIWREELGRSRAESLTSPDSSSDYDINVMLRTVISCLSNHLPNQPPR